MGRAAADSVCLPTGFAIATPNMLGWIKWFRYLDPVYYAFEPLMINEFHNREFQCSTLVPNGLSYDNIQPLQHVYAAVPRRPRSAARGGGGGVAGFQTVNGDTHLALAYEYYHNHKPWR
jgi:ATP-binding cassette subfamily G (WHITE) protein 2 (PDR)